VVGFFFVFSGDLFVTQPTALCAPSGTVDYVTGYADSSKLYRQQNRKAKTPIDETFCIGVGALSTNPRFHALRSSEVESKRYSIIQKCLAKWADKIDMVVPDESLAKKAEYVVQTLGESANSAALEIKIRIPKTRGSCSTYLLQHYQRLFNLALTAIDDICRNWYSANNLIMVTQSKEMMAHAGKQLASVLLPLKVILEDVGKHDEDVERAFLAEGFNHRTPTKDLSVWPMLNEGQQTAACMLAELARFFFQGDRTTISKLLDLLEIFDSLAKYNRLLLPPEWHDVAPLRSQRRSLQLENRSVNE
jgi:hypothetical protein